MPIAEGIKQEIFAKEQAALGTTELFVATDAVSPVRGTLRIDPDREFSQLKEAVGTGSNQGEIGQKYSGTWAGSFYVKPQALGTPPDIGPALIKGAMGVETVNGGSSVVYTLSDSILSELQIAQNIPDNLYQVASGAWAEEMGIELTGGELPLFTFSGGFARFGWAYETVVGAGDATGTTCLLNDADIGMFGVGGVVQIGDQDNTGAGYLITSVVNTPGSASFDFTPALVGTEAAGLSIKTLTPSQTIGGTVIGGVSHTLDIDGVSLGFISANIKLSTGIHGLNKETNVSRANRLAHGERLVTGDLQFYFLDGATGNASLLGQAHQGQVVDIALSAGNTAAARCKIDINKARIHVSPVQIPDADETVYTASFTARQNAVAADEMIITFD